MNVKNGSGIIVEKLSDDALISLRINLEKEFKKRGIEFNVGEIGETLAINFFNKTPRIGKLLRAAKGTKDADAYSRNAERYTIKTIKRGIKTGTIYPDTKNLKRQLFDFLVIVLMNDEFELKALYRFSWKQFLKIRLWDTRMNAWYVPKTKKALAIGECLYEETTN